MKRINIFSMKQIRESSGLYELDSKFILKPSDAADIIRAVGGLEDESQEVFGILSLSTKNEVIGFHTLFRGTINSCVIHPREVFKAAILNNAASIVLFHNHPSGNPSPSNADIEFTNRIVEAGEIIGIEVLDHIIIGHQCHMSLKEGGHM